MSGQHVLIVDDEPDILDSLQLLLENAIEGLRVTTAPSGEDALESIEKETPDLVVSDFKMPGMDGLELLRRIRDKNPELPRILMTAFPDLQIAVDAINQARIETFFTKPLDPAEVVDVITQTLSRRREAKVRTQAFARAMEQARKDRGGDVA